jgi:hypothetical protein
MTTCLTVTALEVMELNKNYVQIRGKALMTKGDR